MSMVSPVQLTAQGAKSSIIAECPSFTAGAFWVVLLPNGSKLKTDHLQGPVNRVSTLQGAAVTPRFWSVRAAAPRSGAVLKQAHKAVAPPAVAPVKPVDRPVVASRWLVPVNGTSGGFRGRSLCFGGHEPQQAETQQEDT